MSANDSISLAEACVSPSRSKPIKSLPGKSLADKHATTLSLTSTETRTCCTECCVDLENSPVETDAYARGRNSRSWRLSTGPAKPFAACSTMVFFGVLAVMALWAGRHTSMFNTGSIFSQSRRLHNSWQFSPSCSADNSEWIVNTDPSPDLSDDSKLFLNHAERAAEYGINWFTRDQDGPCTGDSNSNVCTDPCSNGLGMGVHEGRCAVRNFGVLNKDKWVVFRDNTEERCWVIAETSYVGSDFAHMLNDWLGNLNALAFLRVAEAANTYRWKFRFWSGWSKKYDCAVCVDGQIICPSLRNWWSPRDHHCQAGALLRGHANMVNVWNDAGRWIWKALQKYDCQTRKITFTGFSRGGALVAAASGVLVAEGLLQPANVKVVTFGAPRTWGHESALALNSMGFRNRTWRFVADQDPVPRLPPPYLQAIDGLTPVLRYEHVGNRVSNYRSGCRDNGIGPMGFRGYAAEANLGLIRVGGFAENPLAALASYTHMHTQYTDRSSDGQLSECAEGCT